MNRDDILKMSSADIVQYIGKLREEEKIPNEVYFMALVLQSKIAEEDIRYRQQTARLAEAKKELSDLKRNKVRD